MAKPNIFEIKVDDDFDVNFYLEAYPETKDFYQPFCAQNGIDDRRRLFYHFLNHGGNGHYFKSLSHMCSEKKKWKGLVPSDFDPETYRNLNADLTDFSDLDATIHYLNHGRDEGRQYKLLFQEEPGPANASLPIDFNPEMYRMLNADISGFSNLNATLHFLNHGRDEGRRYKLLAQEEYVSGNSPLFINHDVSLTGAPLFLYEFVSHLKENDVFKDPIIVDSYPSRLFSRYQIHKLYHYNNPDKLREILTAYNPPFIYSNSLGLFYYQSEQLKIFLIKTIFHFHETLEYVNPHIRYFLKSEKIHVVSSRIKKQYEEADCEKVSLFPPFLSKATQERILKESKKPCFLKNRYRHIDRDRVVVGMSGSIVERKGFSLFYQTARFNPALDFVWVGGERDWKSKAEQIYQKAFEELPNFFHVPFDSNPYKYFSLFDCFFLTSLNDPCPIVVLESLLLDKNVIVLKDNIYYDHSPAGLSNYFEVDNRGKSEEEIIKEVSGLFQKKTSKNNQGKRYIEQFFTTPKLLETKQAPAHYLILSYYLRADAVAEIDYYVNLLNYFNLIQGQSWGIIISVQVPEGEDISQEEIIERFKSVLNLKRVFVQPNRGWDSLGLMTGLAHIFSSEKITSHTRLAYVHNKSNIPWRDELFRILHTVPKDSETCDTLVSKRFYVECPQDDLNRFILKNHPMFAECAGENFNYVQGTCFLSRLEFLRPLFEHRAYISDNLTNATKKDDYWISLMKCDETFERYYNFYENNEHNSPMDLESQELVKEGLAQNYFELLYKYGKKGIPDCQFEHALERYIGYLITYKKRVETI